MKTKHVHVAVKATDQGKGEFEGHAAVFGNVDSHREKIIPGAFSESLKAFGGNGAGIPVYWSHRMDDPRFNIGITTEAQEDDRGLRVKASLDLDNEIAAQTYRLLKTGRVRQMSFAFNYVIRRYVETDEDGPHFELEELELHEVSLVQVGANQETSIDSVKNAKTLELLDGLRQKFSDLEANATLLKNEIDVLGGALDKYGSLNSESTQPQRQRHAEILAKAVAVL